MNQKPSPRYLSFKINWSKLGMSLSVICAIHCLAMPFLITLLPLAGAAFHLDFVTEMLLIGSSVAISGITLGRDYFKHHRSAKPLMVLLLAVFTIILLQVTPLPEPFRFLESAGGLLIFAAFLVNRKHMKAHHTCPVHEHGH